MSNDDVGTKNIGPLSAKVFQYERIVKNLAARAKQPGDSREDWASLTEMIAVYEFNEDGKIRHLDVYLQGQLGPVAFKPPQ